MLDKFLTTRYVLSVVLMELACRAGREKASARARWISRLQNEEANASTSSELHSIYPEKQIDGDLAQLEFRVLDQLFEEGGGYSKKPAELKEGEARKAEREV